MKFTRLLAILALNEITAKRPLMGGEAKYSFSEEQLEKIESALAEKDTTEMENQLASLKEEQKQWNEELSKLTQSVSQALTDNKLEASEDLIANISLLGKTCKEYGEKNNFHTPLSNDGKEKGEFDSVVNMNDAHNQRFV